jgi:hypothetical protein
MSHQTSIRFAGIGQCEPIERVVSARARLLREQFPELTVCRVVFESPTPSLRTCHVRVTVATRTDVLWASHGPHDSAEERGIFETVDRVFAVLAARLERMRPGPRLSSTSPRSLGSAA